MPAVVCREYDQSFDSQLSRQKKVSRDSVAQGRGWALDSISIAFPDARKILCVGTGGEYEGTDFETACFEMNGVDPVNEFDKIMASGNAMFDVALMSYPMGHSYKPEVVLRSIRETCRMGLFVVAPMPVELTRNESVVFEFMGVEDPTPEWLMMELEPLVGSMDVPWVELDLERREIAFPVEWT